MKNQLNKCEKLIEICNVKSKFSKRIRYVFSNYEFDGAIEQEAEDAADSAQRQLRQ